MPEEIQRWPDDDPSAVDPLTRRNLEHARQDQGYFSENRDWVVWAKNELARRAQEKERAEQEELAAAEARAALDRRAEELRLRDAEIALRRDSDHAAQIARLTANVRRW